MQSNPQERPILFSGEMVRAILAGRKTQTRHVIKPQPQREIKYLEYLAVVDGKKIACPYGQPGDHLWVRETWYSTYDGNLCFRADGYEGAHLWRPSVHMPRWASRILLEIMDVRVERLQNISEKDVHSEGILERGTIERLGPEMRVYYSGFADYWDFENAKRGFSWETNPFVWVVEFKKL